jgi:hypothetical protein
MKRSLLPKEHGAWAQLGIPLVAALASGHPTLASALFAVSAVCAFLAHEPIRVVLGHRGTRARRLDGYRARLRALVLGSLAIATGVLALVLSPSGRPVAAVVLVASVSVMVLAWRNLDRTSIGEALAGAVLAGASAPVAAASGVAPGSALLVWGAWAFAFVVSTFAVRATTTKNVRERRVLHAGVLALVLLGIVAIARGLVIATLTAPMMLLALALVLARPSKKQVRRIGWALAASTAIMAIAIVAHNVT